MIYPPQEEIDQLVTTWMTMKNQSETDSTIKKSRKFHDLQNECIEKLKFLVLKRTRKYMKFSNHIDLEQDGYEALIAALKTYDPKRGSFTWWADKYISTRIYRAANAHSTIRVPIPKTKECKPHKVSKFPVMLDETLNPHSQLEKSEMIGFLKEATDSLSIEQQQLLTWMYGLNNTPEQTLDQIANRLNLSRSRVMTLMNQTRRTLKQLMLEKVSDS